MADLIRNEERGAVMGVKVRLQVGESVLVRLPWSEVCMHLGMAGRPSVVRLVDAGSAQLLDCSGAKVSFPITPGEAGIYTDSVGFYVPGESVLG